MRRAHEGARAMKILSNPARFTIVTLLFKAKKHLCVNEIAEMAGLSQSATSQHLSFLAARGVVTGHRMGKTMCYVPTDSPITKALAKVITIFA